MTIEDANTLIPTLAALRGEILDLRNLLADMESDCVYWRKRCKEAEIELDEAMLGLEAVGAKPISIDEAIEIADSKS